MIAALALLAPVFHEPVPQEPVPQAAIDAAIERGVEWILAHQEVDGGWLHGNAHRTGHTALALYTLLEAGLDHQHHAVQRALLFLEERTGGTYDTALLIMALAEGDRRAHGARIEALAHQLLEWQHGDFGYPSGADLSNTQFAAMGLRAAARAGVEVPDDAWCALAQAVLDYRRPDDGFGYHLWRDGSGREAYGSMTTAGVGVLSICRERLTSAGDERYAPPCYRSLAARVNEAIDGGLGWMAHQFSVTENPGWGHSRYAYYLYGLERMGALVPTRLVGEHDWYQEGARVLVRDQHEQGHWRPLFGSRDVEETSYAVLFLARATAPKTGVGGRGAVRFAHGEQEGVCLAAAGDTPLRVWVDGWGDDLRQRYQWPGEDGPRVARVVYHVDGREVARRMGSSSRPARRERFLLALTLDEPGTHSIEAEAHLVPPAGGATEIVRSPPLEVTIENMLAPWMRDNALDPRRNLLAGAGLEVRASSSRNERDQPQRAIDQIQSTSWRCAVDDGRPTLTLELGQPVLADVIVVSHARDRPLLPGRWARALEVEVSVNGGRPQRLRMPADERVKGRLKLPQPVRIERVELVIPVRAPGERGERAVGVAEVEAQLSDQ